ncbi:MAG: tRNA (N6-threonylcarbamoyladenosine(37)-N6)-methyltransferase TrmO [Candidatus Methanospirare jalkutatii]|nr:tRNA (N6-threonylcarbamoyladenosine(37)-N6)-methyltransferase TrmO [Candidatus Methanospirare jalkutatii]MCW7077835.1 tRNA (N6-threonylcarbamoyladenosine(37)-N6)-methyltransferase TrmO [Candidatus Methanoxibalbensis ujae]
MCEICGTVRRIGTIHTPFREISEVPRQSNIVSEICRIEIFREYEEGLRDIETFTHIIVLYWLHRVSGFSMLTKTPWDDRLHGVFATRSPYRPNPIGLSVVKLIGREGNVLIVSGIDAVDGTPLIDIKPYVPKFDEKPNANAGWLDKTERR